MAVKTSRRRFLQTSAAVGAAVGAGGLITGTPCRAYAARPIRVEPVDGKITITVAEHEALQEANSAIKLRIEGYGKAILAHLEEENFVAMNTLCPHEGCHVKWEQEAVKFQCPCHDSAFSTEGTPEGGPAAEMPDGTGALTSYPLELADGVITITLPDEPPAAPEGSGDDD